MAVLFSLFSVKNVAFSGFALIHANSTTRYALPLIVKPTLSLLKPIAQAAVATLYVWVKMSAKCWNMFPLTLKSSALFALS
jgi:hypothetical protein